MIQDALRAEEDAWGSGEGIRRGSFTRALRAAAGSDGGASFDPADLLEARPPRDGHPYSITRALRGGVIEEFALGAPELDADVARTVEHGRLHRVRLCVVRSVETRQRVS